MKDTTNLLDYNVWAGTDYLNNTKGFNKNTMNKIEVSNTFSSIGENSLKVISTDNTTKNVRIVEIEGCQSSETYTITLDIINKTSSSAKLRLFQNEGSYYQEVYIPISDNLQTITLSLAMTQNSNLRAMVLLYESCYVYLDNIQLFKN